MREFEFQVYDEQLLLIDIYPLDFVTEPSGLGFSQRVDIVKSKTIDYIVNRTIEKKPIKLSIQFQEPNSYAKINMFRTWYSKYITKKLVLKYSTGTDAKYIDVVIVDFSVSEINTTYNTVPITLQPLSPFYLMQSKQVIASIQTQGKKYPYSYPYAYGGGILENAEIENKFFEDIPLAVRIVGPVIYPQVSLKDESGDIYTTINFPTVNLNMDEEILIDAINTPRITFYSPANPEGLDYYNYVDKSKQTFLYAKPGKSTIIANLDQNEPNAKIKITYVQFGL